MAKQDKAENQPQSNSAIRVIKKFTTTRRRGMWNKTPEKPTTQKQRTDSTVYTTKTSKDTTPEKSNSRTKVPSQTNKNNVLNDKTISDNKISSEEEDKPEKEIIPNRRNQILLKLHIQASEMLD